MRAHNPVSFFLLFLNTGLMEGCAPRLVPETKESEVLVDSEPMESLSLYVVPDMHVVLKVLVTPSTISSWIAALSSTSYSFL
jgi:hypothetical protein